MKKFIFLFIFALLFISVINDDETPAEGGGDAGEGGKTGEDGKTGDSSSASETNKATDKTNSTTSDTTKSTTKADEKNGANYIKLSIGFLGLLFF